MAGEDAAAAGSAAAGGPAIDDIVLLDPVCGMTVERASVRHIADHAGVVYAFCSVACRSSFVREPTAYVGGGVQAGG